MNRSPCGARGCAIIGLTTKLRDAQSTSKAFRRLLRRGVISSRPQKPPSWNHTPSEPLLNRLIYKSDARRRKQQPAASFTTRLYIYTCVIVVFRRVCLPLPPILPPPSSPPSPPVPPPVPSVADASFGDATWVRHLSAAATRPSIDSAEPISMTLDRARIVPASTIHPTVTSTFIFSRAKVGCQEKGGQLGAKSQD